MKRNLYSVFIPLLSLFLMTLFTVSVHADGIINYTYDGSGNRTSAERIINLRQAETDSTGKVKPMLHELTSHRITIYPNPTDGNFSIEIGTPMMPWAVRHSELTAAELYLSPIMTTLAV